MCVVLLHVSTEKTISVNTLPASDGIVTTLTIFLMFDLKYTRSGMRRVYFKMFLCLLLHDDLPGVFF